MKIYWVETVGTFSHYQVIRFFSSLEKAKQFVIKQFQRLFIYYSKADEMFCNYELTDMGISGFMIIHPVDIDNNSNINWIDE